MDNFKTFLKVWFIVLVHVSSLLKVSMEIHNLIELELLISELELNKFVYVISALSCDGEFTNITFNHLHIVYIFSSSFFFLHKK